MAKKIKEFENKVSVSEVDRIISENYEAIKTIVCCGTEISVKRNLDLEGFLSFVSEVTEGCFTSDGEYMPEVRDFYVRKCVIEKYTNVSLPSSTEKKYDVLYQSHIVENVLTAIDSAQFNELLWSIDKKLEHMSNVNIQRVCKIAEDTVEAFAELEKKISSLYSNVSEGDIQKLIEGFGKISEMDENKLIDAIAARRKVETDA